MHADFQLVYRHVCIQLTFGWSASVSLIIMSFYPIPVLVVPAFISYAVHSPNFHQCSLVKFEGPTGGPTNQQSAMRPTFHRDAGQQCWLCTAAPLQDLAQVLELTIFVAIT